MNQVQMQKIGQDVYRVVCANRRFVVHHAHTVIRRTGRSRHFVKFLEGFINDGLTRFAVSLGAPTPAERSPGAHGRVLGCCRGIGFL